MTEPDDPTLPVARDLGELEALSASLPGEAVHRGLRPDLMAMIAPVANLEAWGHIIDSRDDRDLDTSHVEDHDPEWEPPLQTLQWWSEQWRVEHNREADRTPTVETEASFLRSLLTWAYDHEPHWADFARDVRIARRRLEDSLQAGVRAERGAPCMYDECGGARLVRKLERDGRRWRHTDWFCPRKPNAHRWDEDAYARMVTAAHEATKREMICGEMWATIDVAAREIRRSYRTVQTWVNEGKVRKACLIAGKRQSFVPIDDVREQDQRATRRRRGSAA